METKQKSTPEAFPVIKFLLIMLGLSIAIMICITANLPTITTLGKPFP